MSSAWRQAMAKALASDARPWRNQVALAPKFKGTGSNRGLVLVGANFVGGEDAIPPARPHAPLAQDVGKVALVLDALPSPWEAKGGGWKAGTGSGSERRRAGQTAPFPRVTQRREPGPSSESVKAAASSSVSSPAQSSAAAQEAWPGSAIHRSHFGMKYLRII